MGEDQKESAHREMARKSARALKRKSGPSTRGGQTRLTPHLKKAFRKGPRSVTDVLRTGKIGQKVGQNLTSY